MKVYLLILLLILLRLLNDIKERWTNSTKSWITKELTNCNDQDQDYGGEISNYKLLTGIEVFGCNFANTFIAIEKTFANTINALENTIELGTDIVDMA